jgi:hypothetical protein
MEVRPEFKKVREATGKIAIGMEYLMKDLYELHKKYKDDRIIHMLLASEGIRKSGYILYHWLYKEHREESLAYDKEIYSQSVED